MGSKPTILTALIKIPICSYHICNPFFLLVFFLTPNSRSVFLCWGVVKHSFIHSFIHSSVFDIVEFWPW